MLDKPFTLLSSLSLYNNPWECDCNIKKLIKISLIRNNRDNVGKIRCKNYNAFLFQIDFSDCCNYKNYSDFLYIIIGLVTILIFLILLTFCC